ncbi:MAG: alpha-E domain-containing protein [Lachnospiraceae bacterium]
MGIISVEQTNRLFWLGRYSERVYTTLKLYFAGYDKMIDERKESYRDFCNRIDIPDCYGSKEEFLKRYPFDEQDPNSIISNLIRAYDNAIVLREEIGSETLSYIQLAIYEIQKAKVSTAPLIELQHVIDFILAFWASADDSIEGEETRNIIKIGKRIERIDLYARLEREKKELVREVHRLVGRIGRCGIQYDLQAVDNLGMLIAEEKPDYDRIVAEVERIVEE